MGTEEKIIINLADSSNAIAFKSNEIIHNSEFEKIKKEIASRIDRAKAEEKAKDKTNALDTITVLGSRGSGKTSFLKSLAEFYSKDSDIEVIKIIDPTMIEDKGHVFLTIISQIKIKVDKKLQDIECSNRESSFCKKQEWQNKILKLSAGLPSIDGVSASMDGWQDPEYIMNKGLHEVKSAMDLADNFHKLVKTALDTLGKKMFILMLDDVDIDFLRGWPVLETVRKYLTTPYITTIVSGDLRLFSKAVRKKQWSNFGKSLLKNEGEQLKRMGEFNSIVTEMESQYLQKVLKPQYRIKLNTLLEKYRLDKHFGVEVKVEDKPHCLKAYYAEVLSRFGINNTYQKDCYLTFLLGLPLRTQVQFLIKSNDKENPMGEIEVFLSELYEMEVDIDFASSFPRLTTSVILDVLVKNKVLDEGYQLQPISIDSTLNSVYMAFTMLYSSLVSKNKFLVFDYFVKIGYVRNLLSLLGYGNDERLPRYLVNGRFRHPICVEDLIKHSSMTLDHNRRDIMCYTTAFMSAYFNPNATTFTYSTYAGAVALYGLAEKANISLEEAAERLDGAFKEKDITSQQIAYLPASMSQGNKQTTVLTYSIYVLLGAISEIIKMYYIDKSEVEKLIQQMAQIRAYPMPNGVYIDENEKEELEFSASESAIAAEGSGESGELTSMLIKWLERMDGDLIISPHVLGKISTRMYYAIGSVEASVKSKNIGEAMHRRIVAMMNAILIEDIKENIKENLNISNNNPLASDKLFVLNLEKTNTEVVADERLKFSRWMLSCPLFLLYLDYSNLQFKEQLTRYIKGTSEDSYDQLFEKSIYETLLEVKVKDKPERAIVRVEFDHYKKGIDQTIAVISKNMTYDSFNSTDDKELTVKLRPYFIGTMTEKGINKVKKYIIDNSKQW